MWMCSTRAPVEPARRRGGPRRRAHPECTHRGAAVRRSPFKAFRTAEDKWHRRTRRDTVGAVLDSVIVMPFILALLALACASTGTGATPLSVSNTLGSNMVLQRGRPAPIWGWATNGAAVAVEFRGSSLRTTAGVDGLWKVALPPQPATLTPAEIKVTSGSVDITLTNVVFGDVILCSGQSNMEFVLSSAINATAEIAAADSYPYIRVVDGPQQNSDPLPLKSPANASVPHNNLFYNRMNWSVASSKTVGHGSDNCCGRRALSDQDILDQSRAALHDTSHELSAAAGSGFSAVCWFAARDLFNSLGGSVPIGAIDQSYGGTSIQFWMSPDAIAVSDAPLATQCCGQDGGPSCLWNTQIHPYTIGPTQLAGVIWCECKS